MSYFLGLFYLIEAIYVIMITVKLGKNTACPATCGSVGIIDWYQNKTLYKIINLKPIMH